MDGMQYFISIAIIVGLAVTFYRNGNNILAVIVLLIGGYVVYSQETGHTATEFRDDMVNSLDKSAREYGEKQGIKSVDLNAEQNSVK